jgi:hypothetical protein
VLILFDFYKNSATFLIMQTYKVIVYENKTIRWFNDKGELHRLDGPAVEGANGYKAWFVNDKLHRLDGPAIERANGFKEWYLFGKEMTEEEFDKYTKPKPSCEGKVVEVDGKKYKLTAI